MSVNRAKAVNLEKPRRFWKEASAGPVEGGFAVLLDGRGAKTPDGARLVLPTEAAAGLVAGEWAAQGEEIEFAAMPATRLAFTAIDRVPASREGVAEEVARYAGSDLLCYFAEEPDALVARQQAAWEPLLAWAETELGLPLNRATGILHCAQPEGTAERVKALALELDDFSLTALASATGLFGSAVLAFALQRGRVDAAEAHDIARLDEAFQEERWGIDAEAAERTANRAAEAETLGRWFAALR